MARKNSTAYLVMIALISVISAGCKPKPIVEDLPTDPQTPAAQSAVPTPAHGHSSAELPVEPASNQLSASHPQQEHKPDHQHQHTDINAVADKLDPATKANLQQLIDERKHAKPEVQSLAGGGERVQLNGSHSAIAVAVANEDGEVTIYHHGENLKPEGVPESHATSPEEAAEKAEAVKPYPPVKKINAPTNVRD